MFRQEKLESHQDILLQLYLLACHFSQINGHNSESGEEDVNLLEQAVAAAHALHVLTK